MELGLEDDARAGAQLPNFVTPLVYHLQHGDEHRRYCQIGHPNRGGED